MELNKLVTVIARRWYVVVLVAVIAAALAGYSAAKKPTVYQATAQGLVSIGKPEARAPYVLASGSDYILNRLPTYAQLGVTTPVLGSVVNELGLDETPLTLSGRVSSHSVVDKAIIEVVVDYNDPRLAAKIADSTMRHLAERVSSLENGNVVLTPVGSADIPVAASNQKPYIPAVLGAGFGALIGCVIVLAVDLIRRKSSGAGSFRTAFASS